MRKSVLGVLAFGLILNACSDTTLGTKAFEETVGPVIIPGAPISFGMLSLPEISFPLDLQNQEGYELLDNVTSVKARSATLIVRPDSDSSEFDPLADNSPDNFDFLTSLTLSLKATIGGTSQTMQVASLPEGDLQIGSNTSSINLVLDDVDIRDFVEAPDVALAVVAQGTNPQDFVVVDAELRFRVGFGLR